MSFERVSHLEVGLLADTHVPYRMKRLPRAVFEALTGVDIILHAGDVDRPEALHPLRTIAPVYAVRGNVHVLDLSRGGASLPRVIQLRLAGRRVLVTHGHLPGLIGLWFKGRDLMLRLLDNTETARFNARIARGLQRIHPQVDVIVFGHTHRAYVQWLGDTLVVNPGAVCPTLREQPSVARMTLGSGRSRVEIVPLNIPKDRQTTLIGSARSSDDLSASTQLDR